MLRKFFTLDVLESRQENIMEAEKTVCFTGHRSLTSEEKRNLKNALKETLEKCYETGARCFRCGGALGFDTLAAIAVLNLQRDHPDIRLELVLPCPQQSERWNQSDVNLYEEIKQSADLVTYISDTYYSGVLQLRNRKLVDGSDICIAYLKNSHGGGTAFTCAYAIRSGLEFINLYD